MEEELRSRFKEVLNFYNSNINQLANGESSTQVRLSRQINKGASITYDTIAILLEAFPKVSAEWLLRGKGEMIVASSPNEEKEEEALAESLFRNVLVEFMSMVNKRLQSIDNNTQSSVDKLEGITDLLAELRKTA
jgi:hypothetical protein